MGIETHRSYFFDHGLYFECQKCGACCTGSPGIVRVNPQEIHEISEFLSLPVHVFVEQYLYSYGKGKSIREYPDGRCYFFDNGCMIYPVRPLQCRTFPFWFRYLRNKAAWKKLSKACLGIGSGRHYSKEEILDIVRNTFFDKDE